MNWRKGADIWGPISLRSQKLLVLGTFCISLVILFSGCVTPRYQAYDGRVGYRERQLRPEEFLVEYICSPAPFPFGFEDCSESPRFALLRSADLTKGLGHQYFEVVDQNTEVVRFGRYSGKETTYLTRMNIRLLRSPAEGKPTDKKMDANNVIRSFQKTQDEGQVLQYDTR